MPTYTIRTPDGRPIRIEAQDVLKALKMSADGATDYLTTAARAVPFLTEAGAGWSAGVRSLDDLLAGRAPDPAANWTRARAEQQAIVDSFRGGHPILANTASALGAAAPIAVAGLGIDRAARAAGLRLPAPSGAGAAASGSATRKLMRSTVRNAFGGAVVGGAYGAAEPGTFRQRMQNATDALAPSAAWGAGLPLGARAATAFARHVGEMAPRTGAVGSELIDSLHRAAFGLTPSDQPQKIPALADSRGEMDAVRLLRQMGVTPEALEQVQGAAAGKPITTAEAIGPDGMELAQGLRGRAGTTNAIASAALDQRAGLRPDRVLMDASQVAEAHPSAVMGDPYELFKASRERGAPYMEEARRLPPPLDFPLANLYYSPELNGQELDVRRDVKSRGLKYMERSPAQYYNDRSTAILRGELPNKKMSHAWTPQPNKVMLSIDSYDALKNRLQGLIEGEPEPLNKEQRTMKRIADELHTKLINSFPTGEAYAKAHEYQGDYASNASAWRNAQGRLLDPSVDPLSFDSQFSALMPFERNAAAAAGAGDIANLAYKHPFDAGIVSDPAVFEKMGVLFGKTGAQRLADALTTEGTMADFEKPPPTGRDGLYQRLRAAGQAPLNMAGRNSLGGLLYQDPATTAQIMRSYKPNALDTTRVRLPPFLQYGAPAVVGEFQGLGNGPIPSQP